MRHIEFKEAREKAGLTVNQCAKLLRLNPVTVRRFEMDPETATTARQAHDLHFDVLTWFADQTPPCLPSQ